MKLDDWAEQYQPFVNPFRVNTQFDFGQGDTMFYLVDLNSLRNTTEIPDEHIWTILYEPDNPEDMFTLVNGLDNRPSLGYFVCKNKPRFTPKEVIFLA